MVGCSFLSVPDAISIMVGHKGCGGHFSSFEETVVWRQQEIPLSGLPGRCRLAKEKSAVRGWLATLVSDIRGASTFAIMASVASGVPTRKTSKASCQLGSLAPGGYKDKKHPASLPSFGSRS